MINYLIYKLGIFLALILPLKIAYRVAVFVADLQFFISRKDRVAIIDNLNVIFKGSGRNTTPIAREVFRNFAKYLVDFFRLSKIDDNYIKKHVKIKGTEYLDEALKKRRGIIIAGAHLGNWELGAAMVSKLGYPLNVIVLDHKNKLINKIFVERRSSMGVKGISIGIALRKCFAALKKGELLAVLGDRDFGTHGINIDFFGRNTLIPKGPATFAIKTGAPIIPCFLLRNPDDTFTLIFEKEISCTSSGDFDKDVKDTTIKILGLLENYIRRHPNQWYMFRRFWV